MKKIGLAWILILALTVLLLPAATGAATEGEMLLTSDPVEGAVGDIVKVDFYCYPNLTENELLDSLEFSLAYDPEMLTFGSFNMRDEENNNNRHNSHNSHSNHNSHRTILLIRMGMRWN